MKIIKEEYSIGKQSSYATKMIESEQGLKINIEIKSDSYDFQSYARVSVFSSTELKWNVIDHIPYANMKTPPGVHYGVRKSDELAPYFVEDIQTLTANAEAILGNKFSTEITKKKKP